MKNLIRSTEVKVGIFSIEDKENEIGSFATRAINIQKAFYSHVSKRFSKYQLCADECMYKLSDI